jgi:Integrase zinc binding domain
VSDIKASYTGDAWIDALQQKLQAQQSDQRHHLTVHQGIIRYKGRICVGGSGTWCQQLLHELHDSSQGGRSGADVTYHRLRQLFYGPGKKEDVITMFKPVSHAK